ncbi:MAG TPA: glycoside hydrolase family 3 N-terminal domain-containing protein [Anaerolineales bacterium]|nr:glycoside hydrolase family 3 N-terminal domain-containing protein [Anaerolineales bacterium]
MALSDGEMTGQRLLLAFDGRDGIPAEFAKTMQAYRPAGLTLFRHLNIDNPAQLRRLTGLLQDAARQMGLPPLLIAADQEGGQLMAIGGGTTLLPGNMALGATGDPDLARRSGEVLGRELAAMGININYAPSCDVNSNPRNPGIGIRSFGEDPQMVGVLAAAQIEGMQSCGVAACAKHFPGHGDTESDSHHGLPVVPHDMSRLQRVELPPFQRAFAAGARMVMTAHMALRALDGPDAPPATLSRRVVTGLLRELLGYEGVVITDAMDMRAITQGDALGEHAVRALEAGCDLLLVMSDPKDQERVYGAARRALEDGRLDRASFNASLARISELRKWLAGQPDPPDLDVVGSLLHCAVADDIARRSVTLVRDEAGLLPLRLQPAARIAAIVPKPLDLTPADTSSYVVPTMAASLRELHPNVDEFVVSQTPSDNEIAALVERVRGYDLVVLGTLNAFAQPGQQALVAQVLKTGILTVVVALRLPYDLASFPQAQTFVATYSILEPSMKALASALFGAEHFEGKLPVSIPGLYSIGHRWER